ncbi:MAG: nucleotidyltransferase [Candidatus Syntrophoarchaeum caldarius]|uniref:protein adenylyltransferase n=1 Tax=Candidatus Syntropharchaeum caldarium TaxID=1838285 RepID=A0A1F2P716_9EURY|nr:MAG: nucleotidyltransferase [Candidatus Syntrophoarchaeum caldarius]
MNTIDEILKEIEEHRDVIRRFGVKRIGIFGSYTRGEENEESDIDILVEFEKDKKTFDSYIGLKLFLEDMYKKKIDLVISEAVKPKLRPYILGSVKYAKGL